MRAVVLAVAGAAAAAPPTPPPLPCPAQLPGQCQAAVKTAIKTLDGSDMTPDDCCAACVADDACAGWTLNTKSEKCFLHATWAKPNADKKCTSGQVRTSTPTPPPAPPAPVPCPAQLSGQCQGAVKKAIKTLDGSNMAPDDCCAACVADDACVGWTLNTNSKKCLLHATWAEPNAGKQCTSGQVRTSAPTPAPPPPTPTPGVAPAPAGALSVLMLIVDDLRPEVADAYGQKYMHTPNIDRLAAKSTVFNRAYCQQAICGPTRNSFLSGRRPQRTQAWNFIDHFREVGPDWVSFPGYFLAHGYKTYGSGKTYHPKLPPNNDGAKSWSQDRSYVSKGDQGWVRPTWVPSGNSVVMPDSTPAANLAHYTDGANLLAILDDMEYASGTGKPFFLAYGMHKPHLSWHAPEEMWDLYPDTGAIDLPKHEAAPAGMPPIAFTYEMDGKTTVHVFGEGHPIPLPPRGVLPGGGPTFGGGALPHNITQTMRKGYYMAVSWIDHCIGRALDKLDELGHTNNTVVALIGDHGWQLGEHNIWGKHTNFELGTRVPLMFHKPGSAAGRSNMLVESVDLYPTVAALAGLPPPPDVDGTDLSPIVLGDGSAAPNKTVAFSEYPRCPKNVSTPWTDTTSCIKTHKKDFTVMGYSVRTERYRYTAWLHWDGSNLVGDFTQPPVGVELYSHDGDGEADFDEFENQNLADDPNYAAVVSAHYALAVKQWSKNYV